MVLRALSNSLIFAVGNPMRSASPSCVKPSDLRKLRTRWRLVRNRPILEQLVRPDAERTREPMQIDNAPRRRTQTSDPLSNGLTIPETARQSLFTIQRDRPGWDPSQASD